MEGLDRLNAKLRRIPDAMREELRAAIQEGAEEVVVAQKRLAPVDDGDLQMSITYRFGDQDRVKYASLTFGAVGRGKGDPGLTAIITAGNTRVRYAHLVEFGAKPHRIAPRSPEGSLVIEGRVLAPGEAVQHTGAAAQPFFYPAFRANKRRVKSRITRAITKAAKKAAGK